MAKGRALINEAVILCRFALTQLKATWETAAIFLAGEY